MGRACTLASVYRRFGEVAAGTSPLYERVAVAVSESGEALRAEAIGRCWSRGRLLAWLADSQFPQDPVSGAPAPGAGCPLTG